MTLTLALWVFGGFPLALATAVWMARGQRLDSMEEGAWVPGAMFLVAWMAAPLLAACLAFVGIAAGISHGVRALERCVPERPSRDGLERRIADLERELLAGPER